MSGQPSLPTLTAREWYGDRRAVDAVISAPFVWSPTSFVAGLFAGCFCTLTVIWVLVRLGTTSQRSPAAAGADVEEAEMLASKPFTVAAAAVETLAPAPGGPDAPRHVARPAAHCDEDVESIQFFWPRCFVLALMLAVQSLSSLILSHFSDLIEHHSSIIYFLTMIVGLGGNAGGQSVVLTVRRLAFGEAVSIMEQLQVGLMLGLVLAPLAYLRSVVQGSDLYVSVTIGISVFFISCVATACGTALPMLLYELRIDPAHSAPVIQVTMDMIGILIVCVVGSSLLAHATDEEWPGNDHSNMVLAYPG